MDLNDASVLVTGGSGFIGTNFILHVLAAYPSCNVFNFDLGPAKHYAASGNNLESLSFREKRYFHLIDRDIRDFKDLFAVFSAFLKNHDSLVVVHFAAESHVTRSEIDPAKFYSTNFVGSARLLSVLSSLLEKEKRPLRFIHVSTDEVYGPAEKGYFFSEEESASKATSDYAKSKALTDDFMRLWQKTRLFPEVIIVRPTNNFGPYQFPEKFLPRSITRLLRNEDIIIWGDGLQVRDWLFVEDTSQAICLLAEKGVPGEVYNIGANHDPEITNKEMAKRVVRLLGLPGRIRFIPDPRPQHDFRYAVNTAKIRSLGFQRGDFDEQLAKTVSWYQEHQNWWLPLVGEAESIYKGEKK